MNSSKVSIIVPVYNTKIEYFRGCIESLVSQTYQNIEIMVVDDGSAKENAIQYDQIVDIYNNVQIIHKKNGGVSSARNIGIEHSTGEYIAFVDADDWVDKRFIEILILGFENPDVDMSMCTIEYTSKDGIIEDYLKDELVPAYYSKKEVFFLLLYSTEIGGFLCNKMYKKHLITQRLDEALYYSEDFVFTAHYTENIRSAVCWNAKLYYYRQNQSSVSNNYTYNDKIFSLLKANECIKAIYEKNASEHIAEIEKNILKIALNLRARYKLCKANNESQYAVIKNIIQEKMELILKKPEISIVEKVNIILTFIFPTFLFRLKNILLRRKI